MAKRTHHSNNNQSRKNHRNGIKKPKKTPLIMHPGINQKRMHNVMYSRYIQEKNSAE